MPTCAPLTATLLLLAAAAGCASPTTPDQTGNAGGTGNTTGVAGTGGYLDRGYVRAADAARGGGGRELPFPQHRLSQNCGYPTNCTDADMQSRVGHVQDAAHRGRRPGLRVQRPSDNNDTVSEGMAYGMLFAVYMNDKATFDGLWQHAQARRNSKGLLRWHYDANGSPIGSGADNAATDADEDAAFALIMADKQWGGSYLAAANTHLTSMMNNMVAGDNTLRPDDVNSGDVNPSFFAPAYYRVFAQASGNTRWMQVLDRSYTLLELCAHDTTGLVPDWCTTGGGAARNSRYGYDAARTPWRIAQDACWYNEARAKSLPRACGDVLQGRRARARSRTATTWTAPTPACTCHRRSKVRRATRRWRPAATTPTSRARSTAGFVGDEDRDVERVQLLQRVGRSALPDADDRQHGEFLRSLTGCVEY